MFVVSGFVLLGYTRQKTKLEAQWAEPVSLTFHSTLRKLYTEHFIYIFHRCFLPNCGSYGFSVSEEKIFFRNNQKQELPIVAMSVNRSGQNVQSLERTVYICFLPSFSSFGNAVSEEKIFVKKLSDQKQ